MTQPINTRVRCQGDHQGSLFGCGDEEGSVPEHQALRVLDDGRVRAEALKAVRKLRGLSPLQVAADMHMPLRTYEHFEAGHGRLNVDYLHRFCRATRSDPYAFKMAIAIGASAFAVNTADNKFMTIFTVILKGFEARMGERIRDLDPRDILAAVGEMFDKLTAVAEERARTTRAFIETSQIDLASTRPKPGR